jgi:hypothetical protein
MGQVAGDKLPRRSDAETKANAEKYAADMKPHIDAQLERDRGALVRAYRKSPGSWPGGIDSKYNRWYLAKEWTDEGEYIGEEPCIRPAAPDGLINTPVERVEKLTTARATLAAAQDKLGVKPFLVPDDKRKPWDIAGVSRSTWDRQQKAKGELK